MITNAGLPITIFGEVYETTLLGQAAWDYLVNVMRIEFIDQQRELLRMKAEMTGEPFDQREYESVRAQAFAFNRWSLTSNNWFFTDTGCVNLLHQLLKPKNPKVTVAQCREWGEKGLFTSEFWELLMDCLKAGAPVAKGDGGEEPANPPTPPISTTSSSENSA